MVTIGSLSWVAKVEQASRAQRKVDDLQGGFEKAEQSANATNQALGGTEGKLKGVSDASGRTNNRFTRLSAMASILTSAIFFLTSTVGSAILRFTGLSMIASTVARWLSTLAGLVTSAWAAIGGLSGIVATLSGWVSTVVGLGQGFIAWLSAGSAGALALAGAIGAVIGGFVVWILHITGVMDWIGRLGAMMGQQLPAWASDMLIGVLGPFAALGNFINGFVTNLENGIPAAFDAGLAAASRTIDMWIGSLGRTFSRIDRLFAGVGRSAWQAFRGAFNAVVPSSVRVGEVNVAGRSFGGFSIPLPQLQTGGIIQSAGAFIGHPGEMVVPADVTRNINQQTTALAGGGGGLSIGSISIDIGDQSLDVSTLTRREMEDLAELIADELGREVEAIIG